MTLEDLDLQLRTDRPNDLAEPEADFAPEQLLAVLRDPHQVELDVEVGVGGPSVDGWQNRRNGEVGITVSQPVDRKGRFALAHTCNPLTKMTMPLLVDEIDDRVGHAYSGMPDRLYWLTGKERLEQGWTWAVRIQAGRT